MKSHFFQSFILPFTATFLVLGFVGFVEWQVYATNKEILPLVFIHEAQLHHTPLTSMDDDDFLNHLPLYRWLMEGIAFLFWWLMLWITYKNKTYKKQ
jgi:hypothetical protein